ncbi:hypothetical protein QTI66_01410 [Variovorax sp. J22R133]|uniref:hypothetical protein n=1 Tax=Variovorax brevis TaxID=3053503 RepID=UPI0025764B86|nr:hypothetical protein [Variovorax sp. J22R133]MDM0110783.1 hypothetical protein [Variovorax sp. J22R133]
MATKGNGTVGDAASNGLWFWPQGWSWPALAPRNLYQPISSDFSVGSLISVTNVNSSAPDIERDVLQQHSYGRQIGRLLDAVALLVERLPEKVKQDERVVALEQLVQDVEDIKDAARKPRLQRLEEQIDALKRDDPKAYETLLRKLAPDDAATTPTRLTA